MQGTKGDVALTNNSRQKNISMILYIIQIGVLRLSSASVRS